MDTNNAIYSAFQNKKNAECAHMEETRSFMSRRTALVNISDSFGAYCSLCIYAA